MKNDDRVALACVLTLSFLVGACAGEYKNRKSSYKLITIQLSTNGQAEKVETSDDSKIICRMITPTGTKIKQEICASKAEWDAASQRGKDLTNEITRRAGVQ